MLKRIKLVIVGVFVLSVSTVFAAEVYKIDPVHSSIAFSVKHMMLSNTPGQFDTFDGAISYDPNDLANAKVDVTIQVASIDTHNEKRDGHLRGADFFDAEKFPAITFVSKLVTASEIIGDLTMKGVTKEVSIPVTISGPVKGMGGNNLIAINGTVIINRQDYGVSYNKVLDQGGLAVGNDVTVTISIEAEAPAAPAEEIK